MKVIHVTRQEMNKVSQEGKTYSSCDYNHHVIKMKNKRKKKSVKE